MEYNLEQEFKGKTILVTGGTGSIGSEIVRQLLQYSPAQIRVFSRDETKQYELIEQLGYPANINLLIGDVRDRDRLMLAFKGVDIVFHAAAMKHVSISEYNPFEVIKTNVVGSQNVIDAAIEQKVKKVIGISTDKAVHPTGVLGTSKLMMEKLFVNANNYIRKDDTKFACVRFGNVIWSRGSVLPLWMEQAKRDGQIRVTNAEMTRFFMSIGQAATLVLRSAQLTNGGEIFVLNMPAIKIFDLATLFKEKYFKDRDIKIEIIGVREGEKNDEQLFDSSDLTKHVLSDEQMYIVVPPAFAQTVLSAVAEIYPGFKKLDQLGLISSSSLTDSHKISEII